MTDAAGRTVALCFICKNEEKVIARCIESALGFVDNVVAVDTGSDDHTIREIRTVCRRNDLPLTLISSKWVGFGANRTELLEIARPTADRLLLLDADMTIELVDGLPDLSDDGDAWMLAYSGPHSWRAKFIVNSSRPWKYVGNVHEYIMLADLDEGGEPERLFNCDNVVLTHHADGGGDDQDWFTKGTKYLSLLLADYHDEPEDPRTLFYLANTLNELGMTGAAIDIWKARAAMEGTFEEERWIAQFRAAEAENDPHALLECWGARPWRCEPLYQLAMLYRLEGNYHAAELFAREGHLLESPEQDVMFKDEWKYTWGCDFEWAIALWWTGQKEVARQLNELILERDDVPDEFMAAVRRNLGLDAAEQHVVAVVPVKNNLKYTQGIVEQLEAAEVPTLIMDNGSDGETLDYLSGLAVANRGQVALGPTSVTTQPGKTIHEMWNFGIDFALQDPDCTAVAILNNDLALGPQALQRCAAALTDDLVLTCPNYDRREASGLVYTNEICANRYDGTGGIAGFAMILSAKWLRDTGYRFPDDLTWWYGDNHLLVNVIESGYRAAIVTDATCVHLDGGGKTGKWDDPAKAAILEADRLTFLRLMDERQ